jgi:hypothetical protein
MRESESREFQKDIIGPKWSQLAAYYLREKYTHNFFKETNIPSAKIFFLSKGPIRTLGRSCQLFKLHTNLSVVGH